MSVDRTETEAREWERNRVAWNLPHEVRAAPAEPMRQAATESGQSPDATDGAPEDG